MLYLSRQNWNNLFRSEVTAILKKTYFCWFWLFCWHKHVNMIIYSFYAWFFDSTNCIPNFMFIWLLYQKLSRVVEFPPPPWDIWDPKCLELVGLSNRSVAALSDTNQALASEIEIVILSILKLLEILSTFFQQSVISVSDILQPSFQLKRCFEQL